MTKDEIFSDRVAQRRGQVQKGQEFADSMDRKKGASQRIYRRYTEEGLQLGHNTPKRNVSAKLREDRSPASALKEMSV